MATAEAYDQWDDPGLAFSEEQIKACNPKASAAERVNALIEIVPVVLRRSELGTKAKWWEKVADKMVDVITWYCVVAELPGIDREGIRIHANDKAITLRAHKLGTEEEFMRIWHSTVSGVLVTHVTLGRRCASARALSGWTKKERSLSNRVANAIFKELTVIHRMDEALASRTSSSQDGE